MPLHVLFVVMLGLSGVDAGAGEPASRGTSTGWVEHAVVPHERLDAIAGRYGVTRDEVLRSNPAVRKDGWLRAGQRLRIRARRTPPPRRRLVHVVARGQTWAAIADQHGVSVRELRQWNQEVPQAFRAGTPLVVFDDRAPSDSTRRTEGRAPKTLSVAPKHDALSLVPLPSSHDYRVRESSRAFGAPRMIAEIARATARFRITSGYRGELVICDLSDHDGGRLQPHLSHRTGHDVDIRLPIDEAGDIDWDATWALVAAFIEDDEVEYIFLEHPLQAELAAAAERAGLDETVRAAAIQWPDRPGTNSGIVRHEPGHTRHLHIRIRCDASQERCP